MSRVMVLHSAGARSRARVTRHVPAAGAGTSANQKYGGPPIRSRDLAETLPLGAIRDSSPSSGFSTTKSTRKGAPFHGVTGEGRTARSAASPHGSPGPLAWTSTMEKRQTKNAPAVTAASRRAGVNWGPLRLDRNLLILRKLWLNHGTIPSPGVSGGKVMMNKPCLSRRSSVPPSRQSAVQERPCWPVTMIYAAILSSLLALVWVVPAAAQSSAPDAAATCVGSDADSASPEARESACLLELGDRATRKGNALLLKLDHGQTKAYRSNPEACQNDVADKCVTYRLVGYHPSAKRYLLLVAGYEGRECKLVSARDGKATTFLDVPHFAPDGSTFFVNVYDGSYDNWFGIGSVASNPPALVWEMGPNVHQGWNFVRWIDNDQIALRDTAMSESCPDGNCEAVLKRAADGWLLERVPRTSHTK